ncbi:MULTISPECIES: glutamate synthase-related protein [unclassified Streptomyces]|uniref:glutamate synthase-related protein n=1 Tax=unclassified Streptomyces TaxID=2593676 RepID=UPI001BE4E2F7|nr:MULTISPECIES: glutamate synthase-related protein [unclassified Streptomyces]MBT2406687.1 alpha-hydroxy-acid oxidizing protein [Streptomyces sp. ISL-21]MBT2454712.1 alpha-hydroxy-acid oxidizing protein [Streptomyces sp. ISL-86]MBT2612152.1 alpha-hydroxy-acid oxidizing protein [Streptomyces sp. ISL-87]
MSGLHAAGFPEQAVRARARAGTAEVFPAAGAYGAQLFGSSADGGGGDGRDGRDSLDAMRIVPPVFMPRRLERLIELGREPSYEDVDLGTTVGGFRSELPLYLSAFGSTRAGSGDLGVAAGRQAARLGIPMVIGENMVPVHGYRRGDDGIRSALLERVAAYAETVADGVGGVVVQQSTEDADSEVWNLLYSDPGTRALRDSGRLGFELKVGQGAKPGLGGMTVVGEPEADQLAGQFTVRNLLGDTAHRLRCATPGTFTEEIVRQQLRFMRNNFPLARTWVKFHPGRDIARAAGTAWAAGADAVTVDGAEGGTGWAPRVFLDQVGLPLVECLRRIGRPGGDLLATGRIWEGGRATRALALGATAVGLGRAALLAVDEDPRSGLIRLVEALALELRLLTSAVGQYHPADLTPSDLWSPDTPASTTAAAPPPTPAAARPGSAQ